MIHRPAISTARRLCAWLVGSLAVLATSPARADALEPEPQFWHLAFAQGPMTTGSDWLYYLELQPRVGIDDTRALLRAAGGMAVRPGLSLWLGYAWIPVWPYVNDTPALNESRLFQQVLATGRVGPVAVVSRTRLEQRLLTGSDGIAWRIRSMLRGSAPLGDGGWSAVVWDEPFFALNDVGGGPQSGFDQNRLFVGVGRKFGAMAFEIGYINVWLARPGEDRMQHALFTGTMFNFP